jgi:hypothetical protein
VAVNVAIPGAVVSFRHALLHRRFGGNLLLQPRLQRLDASLQVSQLVGQILHHRLVGDLEPVLDAGAILDHLLAAVDQGRDRTRGFAGQRGG